MSGRDFDFDFQYYFKEMDIFLEVHAEGHASSGAHLGVNDPDNNSEITKLEAKISRDGEPLDLAKVGIQQRLPDGKHIWLTLYDLLSAEVWDRV